MAAEKAARERAVSPGLSSEVGIGAAHKGRIVPIATKSCEGDNGDCEVRLSVPILLKRDSGRGGRKWPQPCRASTNNDLTAEVSSGSCKTRWDEGGSRNPSKRIPPTSFTSFFMPDAVYFFK
jgi:hypothetical protein